MILNLNKPIAFFDLETTGINVTKDRIVEISILKVMPDGSEIIKSWRVNPTIPIPDKSSKIHGIYDVDVADKPSFAELGKEINQFIDICDLAGYNSNKFDVPLLVEEFLRADIDFDIKKRKLVDVQVIFFKKEPRTLGAAYRFYCNKEHEGAHSAENDAIATMDVFIAQLEKYNELPTTVDDLALYSNYGNVIVDLASKFVVNEQKEIVFNFGKHKGQLAKNHLDFLSWMLAKGDFSKDTLKVVEYVMANK